MFRQLALLVAAGVLGPVLGLWHRARVPVVVGELAAGALIGDSGLRLINPHASVFPVFYSIGFAMLMMTAGTHVDIRSQAIRSGAARGLLAFVVVLAVSAPLGFLVGRGLGVGHEVLLIILLAGSSAAVAFPILEEEHVSGTAVAFLAAWIAVADAATVVVMPLTLTGGNRIASALLGDAAVIAAGIAALYIALRLSDVREVQASFSDSRMKGWALQLRLSVILLLFLAAVAEQLQASTLVAGFLAGMILVRLGEPDRLGLQISGLANGFFVPIFFLLLGAELDLRALLQAPRALFLAVAMAAGAVVVHVVGSLVAGTGRRVATGLAASAQLGLPAAAASLAIANHLLPPATAAALVAGGLLSLAPATFGALHLAVSETGSGATPSTRQ